jgi:hypothetical protein
MLGGYPVLVGFLSGGPPWYVGRGGGTDVPFAAIAAPILPGTGVWPKRDSSSRSYGAGQFSSTFG